MKRNLQQLADDTFDVLVVGAGITGAAIARAAAMRGLKVAMIEKKDFGHATSANSLKIIHGGLRYLQHFDIQRMRESIKARRHFLRFAPHLVRPLKCILPTYGLGLRGRPVMMAALTLNDLIGWDRNSGVPASGRIPRGRTVSKAQCLDMIPELNSSGLTGGAIWFDGLASQTERLTLSFVLSAEKHGATVANYVCASSYLVSGRKVVGVSVKDQFTEQQFAIRASLVVNAAGPWINDFSTTPARDSRCENAHWAKAINIVVERSLFKGHAVGLSAGSYVDKDAVLSKGSRDFFFVPWGRHTIIGTTYKKFAGKADGLRVQDEDIVDIVDQINRAYPAAEIERQDIAHIHCGVLPALVSSPDTAGDIQLHKKTAIIDHAALGGVQCLYSVVGVKYTTASQVADKLVRLLVRRLSRSKKKLSNQLDFPHESLAREYGSEPIDSLTNDKLVSSGVQKTTISYLQGQYRSEIKGLLRYLGLPQGSRLLCPDRPNVEAEIMYFMEEEMAQTLADVVLRRTDIGTTGYPGDEAVTSCAAIMARERNWSRDRIQEELNSTLQIYKELRALGCGRSEPISVTVESVENRIQSLSEGCR